MELLDGGLVVLRDTASISGIPEIVAEAHVDLSDLVVVRGEPGADGATLLQRVSLAEEWIAQPVPIGIAGVLLQDGLVLFDLLLEGLGGHAGEVRMRVSVIAERLPGGGPCLQYVGAGGVGREVNAVYKAIGRRHVVLLKRVEDGLCDLQSGLALRQRSVRGKIIEGECDLL